MRHTPINKNKDRGVSHHPINKNKGQGVSHHPINKNEDWGVSHCESESKNIFFPPFFDRHNFVISTYHILIKFYSNSY